METFNILQLFYFINYRSLRILRANQTHLKLSDLGKSLDPIGQSKSWVVGTALTPSPM